MRPIDADALAKFIDYGHLNNPNEKLYSENDIREMIDMMPTIDAVPSLTEEEIETIRIHMNAHKETLCNQHRWKEAEEYQQIVDKLETMMDAERREE